MNGVIGQKKKVMLCPLEKKYSICGYVASLVKQLLIDSLKIITTFITS